MAYNANSIKTLTPRESIRENLGMYIGDSDSKGLHQLFVEGIANSIDEAVAGFGKKIQVRITTNSNLLEIIDEGRGIPFGINSEGKDALVEATCNLHGGGKFVGQEGYKSSLGLHGLGLKCIHYLSSWFKVESCRDNKVCSLSFDENDKQSGPTVVRTSGQKTRGTYISFVPDERIFGKLKWDPKTIEEKLQTYALLNNNIEFDLIIDSKLTKKFLYTDGIKDLLAIKLGDSPCVTKPTFQKCDVTNEDGTHAYFEFGLVYTDKGYETEYCYANGGETPNGGTYLTGFKSAYTSLINKMAKEAGLDKSFKGDMVRRGLVLVMIMKADFRLQFAEQTKLTLNSPEARGLASKAVGMFKIEPTIAKAILSKIETEQKADDAAQRKREAQERIVHGGKTLNSLRDMPIKLADAADFNHAELFFVEGDSAAGSAKESRAKNQAIMPLRGKIFNTSEKDLADIIKHPIIKDILTCLGCGVGDNFNIKNLRYDKIIIMTDADPDGGHIELLLTTLFLYHLPELIKQGKVYAAISPLYRIVDARKHVLYMYDEKEAQKWFRGHTGYTAQHIKGLGELDADELYETSMNPEKRHLVQLTTDNFEETMKLYDDLMGESAEARRKFIVGHKLSAADDLIEDDSAEE